VAASIIARKSVDDSNEAFATHTHDVMCPYSVNSYYEEKRRRKIKRAFFAKTMEAT